MAGTFCVVKFSFYTQATYRISCVKFSFWEIAGKLPIHTDFHKFSLMEVIIFGLQNSVSQHSAMFLDKKACSIPIGTKLITFTRGKCKKYSASACLNRSQNNRVVKNIKIHCLKMSSIPYSGYLPWEKIYENLCVLVICRQFLRTRI